MLTVYMQPTHTPSALTNKPHPQKKESVPPLTLFLFSPSHFPDSSSPNFTNPTYFSVILTVIKRNRSLFTAEIRGREGGGLTEDTRMETLKILVVDDESRMRKLVKDFLSKKNFQVLEAGDGEEAMDVFYKEKDIALIILDVMMPKMDGWEVCREVRKNSKVPIIMLTARGDERDELLGFELGVDEYISKPFSPKILVARVEAILRRSGQNSQEEVISAGGITIDKAAHQASVDGKIMELSYKEFELLTYFLENEGIALSREKILNSVWNYDYFGDARTIDTHVKKLRSKMGDKGDYIKTVWGMGYKFEAAE